MPISVQCPGCKAKLNAPDSAAGKRVKCPKCQTPVAVSGQAAGVKAPAPVAAAPTPPKAAALPPMPAARAAKAAAPAVAPQPVQPTPPAAAEVAPAFPVVTTAAKPAAKAKSGLGTVLVILAVVAGGGLLLCVGGIGAAAMYFLNSDEPAPAAPDMAAGPATPVESPRGNPVVPIRPAPAPVSNLNWVAYEDSGKGFKAVFPGGKPQPLDPLESVKDPEQRELAAAMMRDWTVLGVTHGSRKYTLTAAPLELGSVPANVYLDRMAGGLAAIHSGFSLDAQPQADSSAPLRDYVLKGDNAGKLLRVVATGGHVYQLLIEGEAGLSFSDPAAKEYFEKFQAGGVSSAAVASSDSGQPKSKSKSKNKRRPGQSPPEEVADGIDWRPFTGQKLAFTIKFPGVTPQEEDPLALVVEANRPHKQQAWTAAGVVAESYVAEVGDRRYGVTAFRDPNLKEEGSIRFESQMRRLLGSFMQDLYRESRDRAVRSLRPSDKLVVLVTGAEIMADGSKAVFREACLGHYGFVIRVEGPATMEELDPQVHKFLDSLEPPPDAAPLPLNVKPLPGQRTGKTKKKS